jgi:hypothetical protein
VFAVDQETGVGDVGGRSTMVGSNRRDPRHGALVVDGHDRAPRQVRVLSRGRRRIGPGAIGFEQYLGEQLAAGTMPYDDAIRDYTKRPPRGATPC